MDRDLFYGLTTKILTGEASENEKQTLKKCLSEPEYRKIFEWLNNEWQNELKLSSDEFSYEKGLEKLRLKISLSNRLQQKKQKQFQLFKQAARIAASVVVILSIGILGNYFIQPGKKGTSINYVTCKTHRGERKLVQLPDGTSVHLNAGSWIRYPEHFEKKERNIEFAGEAFFEVARNPEKPFIIRSGNFETTVLGTSFNVLCSGDKNIAVTVESGKVKVASLSANANIILIKGDQAVFDENQQQFQKTKAEAGHFTDWHKNILRIDEIPAGKAFEMMEQWYNVHIQCELKPVLERKIRAVYTNEPLENIMNDLQFMIGFEYEYKNDSTIIIK